jgi:norsolorinic acid ketoreductase
MHGIYALDCIIANAGSSSGYAPTLTTSLAALRSDFETNTLGPIKLFQACYDLLRLSKTGSPKFVLVSSVLGSIGALGGEAGPTLAYGVSKAAANFFVRKVHFEHEDVVALAIHPG